MGIDGKSYQISYQKVVKPQKHLNLPKNCIQLEKKAEQTGHPITEPE
jgi:hypothetical protein